MTATLAPIWRNVPAESLASLEAWSAAPRALSMLFWKSEVAPAVSRRVPETVRIDPTRATRSDSSVRCRRVTWPKVEMPTTSIAAAMNSPSNP